MSSSGHSQHYAMDIILQRVQALELRVGQLESQVIRLQEAPPTPTAASLPSPPRPNHLAVPMPIPSEQNTAATTSPSFWLQQQIIRAAELDMRPMPAEEARMQAASSLSAGQCVVKGEPSNIPSQQLETGCTKVNHARPSAPASASGPVPAPAPKAALASVAASAPRQNQIASSSPHHSTAPLPEHRTNPSVISRLSSTGNLKTIIDVAIKVFGTERHAQAGLLQPPSPKDWQLRLRLHLDPTGTPSISLIARISKQGPLPVFHYLIGREMPFATFRIDFSLEHISAPTLELGGVADPLLLPPHISSQLHDPNELPTRLRYLAFRWRKSHTTGFEQQQLDQMPALSRDGTALLKALQLLGARPGNAVQIWFLCTESGKTSQAVVDCFFRAIGERRGDMYGAGSALEERAENALLDVVEMGGN